MDLGFRFALSLYADSPRRSPLFSAVYDLLGNWTQSQGNPLSDWFGKSGQGLRLTKIADWPNTLSAKVAGKPTRMNSPDLSGSRTPQWALLGYSLILLCGLLYLWVLGSNRALTNHEVYLAGPAKQMVLTGNWLIPAIGDQPWLEKPPLPHWLVASLSFLTGVWNEWTVRIPSAIAGIGVVLVMWRLSSHLFGQKIGAIAALVQATSVYMVTYARLAEGDVLLQLLFVAAIAVFAAGEFGNRQPASDHDSQPATLQPSLVWSLWILIGLMSLVKGVLFGAVLFSLTIGGWAVWKRDLKSLLRWYHPHAIGLCLLITFAWPTAVVFWAEPKALTLWYQHTFGRVAGEIGYTEPWWYYFSQVPLQMLPWTPWLVWGMVPLTLSAKRDRTGPEAFCLWWFVSHFVLFSCSSGKHHHYLLYALPAFSPVVALGLAKAGGSLRYSPWQGKVWSLVGFTVAVTAIAAAIGLGLKGFPQATFWIAAIWLPALAISIGLLAESLRRREEFSSLLSFGLSILVVHLLVQSEVMPRRDRSLADKQFLAEVAETVPQESPLFATGAEEMARHLFYLSRPTTGVWFASDLADRFPPTAEDIYVIARGTELERLQPLGRTKVVLRSRETRRATSELDRYTLFRISRPQFAEEPRSRVN
jgi:4-amino-4-deoxy-L-arabinose transferase-like glycosyltransferase